MKVYLKMILLLFTFSLVSCSNNDDDNSNNMPTEALETSIVGQWEHTSGVLLNLNLEYLIFNENNTLELLLEDALGFRDQSKGNYTSSEGQITIDTDPTGVSLINFTLNDSILELIDSDGETSIFNRVQNAPAYDEWIIKPTVVSQGNAPWNGNVDIAYNGTQILLGNGYSAESIGLINPNSLELEGAIITTQSAFAVEIEKLNTPARYLFQSDNGFPTFTAYFEETNAPDFTSLDIGSWIHGLASVNENEIWVSSQGEQALYLLNYADTSSQIVERFISLERRLDGMDYQDGFLFICSRGKIYKCDVSTSFEIIDTYSIEGYAIHGITYDGTNFWVNARSRTEDIPYQIIKTSLTL